MMKKKLFLACLSFLIIGSVFTTQAVVNEEIPTEEVGEIGGGNDGDCLAPKTNICMKVTMGGFVVKTVYGVLTINIP